MTTYSDHDDRAPSPLPGLCHSGGAANKLSISRRFCFKPIYLSYVSRVLGQTLDANLVGVQLHVDRFILMRNTYHYSIHVQTFCSGLCRKTAAIHEHDFSLGWRGDPTPNNINHSSERKTNIFTLDTWWGKSPAANGTTATQQHCTGKHLGARFHDHLAWFANWGPKVQVVHGFQSWFFLISNVNFRLGKWAQLSIDIVLTIISYRFRL